MAILRQLNSLPQGRIDIPHLRSLESSVAADFDVLAGLAMAGEKQLVLRGFEVLNVGVGVSATTLQIQTANGLIFNKLASESGTMLWVSSAQSPETLDPITNAKIIGGWTPSSTNFIGIDFSREADVSTTDIVQFIDPLTEQDSPKQVPLAQTLDYKIVISTTPFGSQTTITPVAKVQLSSTSTVETVEDARPLMFRLGSGGDNPDSQSFYSDWTRRENTSTTDSTGFTGGDKAILNQKDWQDAVMTRMWELGGGENWFSATADRNVTLITSGPPPYSNGDYFEFTDPGVTNNIKWEGLRILFDSSTGYCADIEPGDLDGFVPGDVLYVDLDRSKFYAAAWVFSTAYALGDVRINDNGKAYVVTTAGTSAGSGGPSGTASSIVDGGVTWKYVGPGFAGGLSVSKSTLQALSTGAIPGSRWIIAWRDVDDGANETIFTRNSRYPLGTPIAIATLISPGIIRTSREKDGTDFSVAATDTNPVAISSFGGEIDATTTSATNKVGLKVTGKGTSQGILGIGGGTAGTLNGSDGPIGVEGTTLVEGGRGVVGTANVGIGARGVEGTSSSGTGVYGLAIAGDQAGVRGYGTGSNGFGVYGEASVGTDSVGVYGYSSLGYGVQGTSDSDAKAGVRGSHNGASVDGKGVWGDSDEGVGVRGQSTNSVGGVFTGGGRVATSADWTTNKYALVAYGGSGYASIYAQSAGDAPGVEGLSSDTGSGGLFYGALGEVTPGTPRTPSDVIGGPALGVGVVGIGTINNGRGGLFYGLGSGAGVHGMGGGDGTGTGKGGVFTAGYGAGDATSGIEVFARAGTEGSLGVAGGQSSLSAALWGANGGAGFNGTGAVDGTDGGGAFQIASFNGGNGGNGGTYNTFGQQAGIGGQGGYGFFVTAGNGGSGGYGVSGGGGAGNKNGGNGGQAINAIGGNGGYADSGATTGSGGPAIFARGGIAGRVGGGGTIKGEDSPAIIAYGGGYDGGGYDDGSADAIKGYGSGTGSGVYGEAGESSTSGAGVEGYAVADGARGVYGHADTGATAKGVEGSSLYGIGVKGTGAVAGVYGESATAEAYGVSGYCSGNNGRGVWGVASVGSGAVGVLGNNLDSGVGVKGTGVTGFGVRGEATGSGGVGVYGSSGTGFGAGIQGHSSGWENVSGRFSGIGNGMIQIDPITFSNGIGAGAPSINGLLTVSIFGGSYRLLVSVDGYWRQLAIYP